MSRPRTLKFGISIGDQGDAAFRVTGFQLAEELSRGCRGTIDIEAQAKVDLDDLIGEEVVLTIRSGEQAPERHFQGVVLGAELASAQPEHFQIALEMGARLELLKLGQNTRIFQKQSVPEVVREVLQEAGLDGEAQSWKTASSYSKRDFVTQFNESDFAFISRLLAGEGIGFAIRNEDKDTVVFFDGDDGFVPLAHETVLVDRGSTQVHENTVLKLRDCQAGTCDAVMVRDYDFKRPAFDLSHKEQAPKASGREVYLHPGGFVELPEGKRLARRALERLQVGARLRHGQSDSPFFEPGRTFTLQEHPRSELNGDHALIAVVHRGESSSKNGKPQDTYSNEFRAIPKGVPFRPPTEAKPVAHGIQVAFVTGPPGQELHGSEHGEVKVRLAWDPSGTKDDRSSTWLRVGQLALGGSMIVPRVGFEVIVDRELGDLDRPLVVGHLYNGEAPPPYSLPQAATKSSIQTATTAGGAGANELRMEDSDGAEEIMINASKDFTCSSENDAVVAVQVNATEKTGANHSFSVGANHTSTVVGSRTLKVGANQSLNVGGDLSVAVGGASKLDVGAMRRLTVGGDLTENTQGSLTRTVGGLQSVTAVAGYQRKVVGQSQTTVGAAWIEACATSRASTCGGARIETVAGLKMVKAKTASVNCGVAHVLNAASVRTKVGGNRVDDAGAALLITAGGGLSVKADNINITGKTKVVLRVGGSTLELTPGSVKLKSSSVDLKGVKKLGSTSSHNSN
jgi:type VI secretion system secreted protein VgrG